MSEQNNKIATKWTQLMDSSKGCKEYNPQQSFALQVFWIVRSPKAAKEMIQMGFKELAKATKRDTPTTVTYLFRVSFDQSIAQKYKNKIKTISQHPHYQPMFKNLKMGLTRNTLEQRLKLGGINPIPITDNWDPNELLCGHEEELDYNPIILECTELYLDSRSFYDHSCSREWMKALPEVMKPSRSLKPITYCLGFPRQDIWENALESHLKAILIESLKPSITSTTTTINQIHNNTLPIDNNNNDSHNTTTTTTTEDRKEDSISSSDMIYSGLQSGLFFYNQLHKGTPCTVQDTSSPHSTITTTTTIITTTTSHLVPLFLEFNLIVKQDIDSISICRQTLTNIQSELQAYYMIILPCPKITSFVSPSIIESNEGDSSDVFQPTNETNHDNATMEIRVMMSYMLDINKKDHVVVSPALRTLLSIVQRLSGRVIIFENEILYSNTPCNDISLSMAVTGSSEEKSNISVTHISHNTNSHCSSRSNSNIRVKATQAFLQSHNLHSHVSILDSVLAQQDGTLAGYPLHPLYSTLTADTTLDYHV